MKASKIYDRVRHGVQCMVRKACEMNGAEIKLYEVEKASRNPFTGESVYRVEGEYLGEDEFCRRYRTASGEEIEARK